ncbi:hypothetical protein [Streptomyces fulvoviolaceus]|uniref:hypothetical protein n=1 Tax=Streptomyces fulvoviolaceus TaxID=285535 RepID=UPI0021C21B80|nr:hypothetical protein [Streptomyces fulvoviolaceus]MCT9075299.1 hypothetical protein [Streptomyces fulvoviolaceus]
MGETSAQDRLAAELRKLKDASNLSYTQIDTQGRQQTPVAHLGRSKLSGWLKGEYVPEDEWPFQYLISLLEPKAARNGFPPRGGNWWRNLRQRAATERDTSAATKRPTGHSVPPVRPAGPGALEQDPVFEHRDRVFYSHSAWIEQFILPARLLDRDDELRELEVFCTADDAEGESGYVWWQAEPWAGKSALISEFVTRQRPADVDVVSYFIADRLDNNDRDLFLEGVTRQLAALAGRDSVTPGSRAETFPGLCEAAAEACRGRGRRLVLVVDGLDEDRGAGPGGFSIAALLPKKPPMGMRVVVTGRPNPLVPDGVPWDHPLRDEGVVRTLAASPHARAISDMAGRELQRLLDDEPLGNDVLGLLAVARGGLTAKDLADLAGARPYQVRKRLRGITGRSFVHNQSGHVLVADAENDLRAHVLGHEELRRRALAELGDTAMATYEARLHAWADDYRAKGWPADTPPYLLYDYSRMLRRSGGTERLVPLVLDPRRQRILLTRAAVDAALSEIELARQVIEHEAPGDLATMAALAVSRDLLHDDARALPLSIPVAFARLGYPQRAMDLALAAPYPEDRAIRLAKVTRALASVGDGHAVRTAQEAARWAERARRESAPSNGDEYEAEVAVGEAAVALIAVGQDRQGRDLLDSLWLPAGVGETLKCEKAAEASVLARSHSPELAEELLDLAERYADELVSDSPSDPTAPVTALAGVAQAADSARASRLFERIRRYAKTFPAGLEACAVHAAAASALAAEHPDEAAALAHRAARRLGAALRAPETLSRDDATSLSILSGLMLTSVTQALVDTGAVEEARELVACVPENMQTGPFGMDVLAGARAAIADAANSLEAEPTAEALAQQACRLAEQGQPDEAKSRLHEALAAFAASLRNGRTRQTWLIPLCEALGTAGWHADGERLARSLRDPVEQVRALATVAASAAAAGHLAEARRLAHETADRSRTLEGVGNFTLLQGAPGQNVATVQSAAAQALAHVGEREAALSLAAEVDEADSGRSRRALIAVAAGLRAHAYAIATATELVDRERERLLTADAGSGGLGGRIARLAELLTAIGGADPECRDRLHQAIEQVWSEHGAAKKAPLEVEDILVVVVLAAQEQRDDARKLLEAWEKGRASVPPWELPTAGFAIAHAVFGDYDAARRSASRHNVPYDRAEALAAVAAYLTRAPAVVWSASDSHAIFTRTLRTLALLEMPPSTATNSGAALRFVADALVGDGWHHALPPLARIAPEAVERVRDIVFTHRGLEISADRTAQMSPK